MKVWSITAAAIGLSLASGCYREEETPTSAPPSPLPTADISRPVQLPPDKAEQGGEKTAISSFKRDLSKDLASPVVEPGGPTTYFAPAGKPDPAMPSDATRSVKP